MAAYRLNLSNHLIPYFGEMTEITEESLQQFVDLKLAEGLSAKRIKDIMVVMKMVMKFGRNSGLDSPMSWRPLLPKEYRRPVLPVFTINQQKILMDYLEANFSLRNLGILICLNTGMRIGEICALKWKDIDLRQGEISVTKTIYRIYLGGSGHKKTQLIISPPKSRNSYRVIPLPLRLLKVIKKVYKDKDPESYVINNRATPLEPRLYREYFRRLLRQLKLPQIKFHGLRHSFATRCIESGCDYKAVSAILGHSDIATTLNLYVHPTHDQKRRCIERMLNSLSSTSTDDY